MLVLQSLPMSDAFPLLRRCHLFVALNDADLKELASRFVLVEVAADDYVFKQGDPGEGFFIIQSGQVEVEVLKGSGQFRKLTTLVEGDYFGEMALVRHVLRSASVKAIRPLKLFKLTSEAFEQSVLGNAKIKPSLEVAIHSRMYARGANFKWLAPNEIVYILTLQHPVFLASKLWKPALVILASFGVASLLYYYTLSVEWQFIPLLILLAGLGWSWWNWEDFHNDWYVVTNQRVVDIDKVILFYDSRAEAPLGTITSTVIKSSELGQLLNFGNVIINTFSGPVIFHNVPYPQATSEMILEQVNRSRVQQKLVERNQLKNNLRTSIGLEPPTHKPPPPPKKTGLTSRLGALTQISLKVREQQGDTIIYHKHVFVLFREVAGYLAGGLLTLATGAARLLGSLEFIDLGWYLGVSLLVLIGLLLVIAYKYLDWKNDIYMVTSGQIMDIESKPFGNEQRKAANLDAITNISFVRPGLLYQLFNFGTVTINAGPGGEMKFFDVFDPMSVQQDIYRRKESLAKSKAEVITKQRVEELSQYMAAFYEVMEDERKKRETGGK